VRRLFPLLGAAIRVLALCSLALSVLAAHHLVAAQGAIRIIFLHHSVGYGLIDAGAMREALSELGYEFYDHGYNDDGLRLADGTWTGTNFNVPEDNTYPDGMAYIFSQPLHDPPDNTFSYLMQYDVIIFKSCFPTSNIGDDAQLEANKGYYLTMRDRMDQFPNKLFIIVTQPPQVPLSTNAGEASRARELADWLASDEFLAGHPNVATFDLFDLLADDNNLLREEYRVSDDDGHPNDIANQTIGPIFVDFIDQAIRSFYAGAPLPTTADQQPAVEATQAPEEQAEPGQPMAAQGAIDDFEAPTGEWWPSDEGSGSTVECSIDSERGHQGASSLRIEYSLVAEGWVDCGQSYDPLQDWSSAGGVSIWVYAEGTDLWPEMAIFTGSPDNATPYVVSFEAAPQSDWVQYTFAWADFVKPDWADPEAPANLDPAQVVGYSFSVGGGEAGYEGTLWIDDVTLVAGEPAAQPVAEEPSQEAAEEPAAPEEVEATEEEEAPPRGLCPGAGLILPLGALGLALAVRRRPA